MTLLIPFHPAGRKWGDRRKSLPLFAVQNQGTTVGEFSENTVGEHEIVKNL